MKLFNQEVLQFLRNLFTLTFTGNNDSLTTLVLMAEGDAVKMNQAWKAFYAEICLELNLLASNTIDFTNKEKHFKIKDAFFGLEVFGHRAKFQPSFVNSLQDSLQKLILKVKNAQEVEEYYTELKIERDAWDKYDLLDAQYYMPILINNIFLSFTEQILIVHFVIFMTETDNISYFDMQQSVLVAEYLDFCKMNFEFLNNKNAIEYLDFIINNKLNEQILENLNFLALNFFEFNKHNGKLLPFKKDYFN